MNSHDNRKFQNSIIFSSLLHLTLMVIFFFGMPSMYEKPLQENEIITFDIVNVSDINNIKTEDIIAKAEVTNEKSREVKKSATAKKNEPIPEEKEIEEKKNALLEQEKPLEREVNELTSLEKIPLDTKKEEEKRVEPKKEPVKESAKKIEPTLKKEIKKEIPKPKSKAISAAKEEDSIDSILNNLEDESIGDDGNLIKKNNKAQIEGKRKARGDNYNEDLPMSITEMNLIKNKIDKNWRKPLGVKHLERIQVYLRLMLEKNGDIKDVVISKIVCPLEVAGATCKQVADGAVRAARQSSPFENLPTDRYDIWRDNTLLFVPSAWDF